MKHIDAKYLWVQSKVKSRDLEMDGVATGRGRQRGLTSTPSSPRPVDPSSCI